MIPPVQHWTGPDRVRPSPVQSSPSIFWTGIGPIRTFSGPELNWPGLIWTSPDRVRPSPVQSSPSIFWTGIGPIRTFSGPELNWPGLIWTSPAQYPGLGYFFTVLVF
jgi:hypothetical protein